jgi:hypothetical protein|tara:strand:- start:210 stop:371 length:162 start_codon:yes stop_codon:yes gene_type:complete
VFFFFFFFFFSFALLLLDQLKALVVVSPTRFRDFKKNDAGVGGVSSWSKESRQ